MKILLRGASVFQRGGFFLRDIAVSGDRISCVGTGISPDGFDLVFDLENKFIVPGFADVHVHLREPGFSYKETIASGTRAAAHGGYTLVCAMPNLSPAPDCMDGLEAEFGLIRREAVVKVLPYGCITRGEHGGELADIADLAPCVAGFSDDGKGVQSAEMMREAMLRVKAAGSFISAHCEDETLLRGGCIHDGRYAAEHGHRGICSESEWGPIARDIELVRETGCRYHVCHVSAKESVAVIRAAKREGLPVTCETAPHYLTLCEDDLEEDGRFKMNPPLRAKEDRDALIEGLLDGTIDAIATDHAPHTDEEKSLGLEKSLMGITGLETAFPVLYTKLVRGGTLSFEKLVGLLTTGPRRVLGKEAAELSQGSPADFTVLDTDEEYAIDPGKFLSLGKSTPFSGWRVRGKAVLTVCGGRIAYREDVSDA